jgi:hypothetical protein
MKPWLSAQTLLSLTIRLVTTKAWLSAQVQASCLPRLQLRRPWRRHRHTFRSSSQRPMRWLLLSLTIRLATAEAWLAAQVLLSFTTHLVAAMAWLAA